jgi:hypothetical protein
MATRRKGKKSIAVSGANAAIGGHVANGIAIIASEGGSEQFQKARARTVGRQMVSMIKKNLAAQKRGDNNTNGG